MKEEWLRIERIEYSNDRMGNGYVYDEKVDGKLNGIRPLGRYSRNRNSRGDDIEIDDDVEIMEYVVKVVKVVLRKRVTPVTMGHLHPIQILFDFVVVVI